MEETCFEEQRSIIRSMLERKSEPNTPLLGEYFQDLRYRLHEGAVKSTLSSLLMAVFEFGDSIHNFDHDVGAFNIPLNSQSSLLLTQICKSSEKSNLISALHEVFSNRSTIAFCSDFWVWRARELGIVDREGQTDQPSIDINDLRDLHGLLMARIKPAIEDDSIYNSPFFYSIAEVLAFDGNYDGAKEWISTRSLEDGKFLAKICRGILGHTVGSNPRVYSMMSKPNDKLYDVNRLLLAADKHADSLDLSDDEKTRIKALQKGLTQIKMSSGTLDR